MVTVVILLSTAIIVLLLFCLAMSLSYRGHSSDRVSLSEMERFERHIQNEFEDLFREHREKSVGGEYLYLDIFKLAETLKLQVAASDDLSEKYRGSLNAPVDEFHNGLIKYGEDESSPFAVNFDIMHEIVHYLLDVGRGKKVSHEFAKPHRGNKKGHREQIIDYYAAAAAIPKTELQERLRNHSGDPYDDQFVEDLIVIYRQPKDAVERRIGEVLALQ